MKSEAHERLDKRQRRSPGDVTIRQAAQVKSLIKCEMGYMVKEKTIYSDNELPSALFLIYSKGLPIVLGKSYTKCNWFCSLLNGEFHQIDCFLPVL